MRRAFLVAREPARARAANAAWAGSKLDVGTAMVLMDLLGKRQDLTQSSVRNFPVATYKYYKVEILTRQIFEYCSVGGIFYSTRSNFANHSRLSYPCFCRLQQIGNFL